MTSLPQVIKRDQINLFELNREQEQTKKPEEKTIPPQYELLTKVIERLENIVNNEKQYININKIIRQTLMIEYNERYDEFIVYMDNGLKILVHEDYVLVRKIE
ncbi:MAG: hypothetical protein DRZ76_04545 [Candidatus Nealsonbacteria bacterium]|nr:MAG: hypothetical protein DRZ76_04545 [Candidatus Nealsonbacteria bacterium]